MLRVCSRASFSRMDLFLDLHQKQFHWLAGNCRLTNQLREQEDIRGIDCLFTLVRTVYKRQCSVHATPCAPHLDKKKLYFPRV